MKAALWNRCQSELRKRGRSEGSRTQKETKKHNRAQKSAKERKNASTQKSARERKRAQKSAKERLCVEIANNQVKTTRLEVDGELLGNSGSIPRIVSAYIELRANPWERLPNRPDP